MPLHIAARMHAFVHGFFKPSDETLTRELYERVRAIYDKSGLMDEDARFTMVGGMAREIGAGFGIDASHPQIRKIGLLIYELLEYEGVFNFPEIDLSERRSVTQLWELRDELKEQRAIIEAFPKARAMLIDVLTDFLSALYQQCPTLLNADRQSDGVTVETDLLESVGDLASLIEIACGAMASLEADEIGLFKRHIARLETNMVVASGGNPRDPNAYMRTMKPPSKSDIKDPSALLSAYMGGTPWPGFFQQDTLFTIPTETRFEHHHIVAGSGHGKTQTLQYLIASDLEAVARGDRSVVVIDSQGDMINAIANLTEFAPGGPLHDRVVIIDPTDVEYPVSLNLFDVGMDRLSGYAPLERERLLNSILELYDFVLGSLLAAEMTQKQSVIFRYVTRLMLHIPDATIHTLRELMEPESQIKFAPYIEKLSSTARHFFETEFASKEFEQTKKQVLRRLWGILENQTFERMFSHPRSKLDIFGEMNAGKIILINTAKDLLKENGTQMFGRFFIAMIAQAAQERATLPAGDRLDTIVYVDEAADYFDQMTETILAQARKYRVGMVLAHQYLGQLSPKLQEAFAANTSIKFAGGVSARDARTLSQMMYCESRLIEAQPKGAFASFIRGQAPSAVPLRFPFGALESKDRMTPADAAALRDKMRAQYAVHYSELDRPSESDGGNPFGPENPDSDDDLRGGTAW